MVLTNINTASTLPVYMDKTLQKATQTIWELEQANRKNGYKIATIMVGVETSGCYESGGFKSVADWAMDAFGYKKSMVYDYLKIGKEFVRDVLNAKGKSIGVATNLLPIPGTDVYNPDEIEGPAPAPERDFNPTQVGKMLSLGHETARKLVEMGKITPDMSTTDIGKVVKAFKSGTLDNDDEEPETTEPLTVTEADAEPGHRTRKVNLDKVSTNDLIAELYKRGYYVADGSGMWMDGKAPAPAPITPEDVVEPEGNTEGV